MKNIAEIDGIEVGHSHDKTEGTGCTMILCREGAIAGVDIRGSAPGTREVALLNPTFMIRKIHGIMLTGGSAFGLRTVDGAMQYCTEEGIGFQAESHIIPIIPGAVIYDLYGARNTALPDVNMGYLACKNVGKNFTEGLVGAGTGARVGKILGLENSMRGGLASTARQLPDGTAVAVLVVVNALGDVVDPGIGKIIAGARHPENGAFADSYRAMMTDNPFSSVSYDGGNTTLAVVATNAAFSKEEVNKIAQMAQNGIARATRPAHTMYDGDAVFALSTAARQTADINVVGETAAQLVSEAIVRAVSLTNEKK